jgi:thioredoxin-related protein
MKCTLAACVLLLACGSVLAQDRDTKVRNDRQTFKDSAEWVYNDLAEGVRAARETGKPLMVVFRCIPCEACKQFDEDVARRDPIVRDLLDQFVCVRIVQGNTMDLTRFQHDFDQSFAAYMMDADLTIYARYGTRSARPEFEDVSLDGLRKTMEAALQMHEKADANTKASLAGKQVRQTKYKTPVDYPSLAGRYGSTLDYEGKVAQSCLHCHQVREAERLVYRTAGEPIPDAALFPYPDPDVLGLKMDAKGRATVERVAPGSSAERDGLKPGDEIVTLAGQPMLSIADVQWVLHNAPASGTLDATVRRRDGTTVNVPMTLPEGWRGRGDLSWRATTWDLRRMGLGGLWLEELTDEERDERKLPGGSMALRVRHVGEYGEHAVALRAGFKKDDVVVAFDDRKGRMSESELLAYTVQQRRPGDEATVEVLRDGDRKTMRFKLQ